MSVDVVGQARRSRDEGYRLKNQVFGSFLMFSEMAYIISQQCTCCLVEGVFLQDFSQL